jgi:hypothetical protein
MQGKSARYEPPSINDHPGETPPREPPGRGELRCGKRSIQSQVIRF